MVLKGPDELQSFVARPGGTGHFYSLLDDVFEACGGHLGGVAFAGVEGDADSVYVRNGMGKWGELRKRGVGRRGFFFSLTVQRLLERGGRMSLDRCRRGWSRRRIVIAVILIVIPGTRLV